MKTAATTATATAAAAVVTSVMPFLASVSLVGFSSLVLQATATRVGDAHHGNAEAGLFYVFGPEITIVGASYQKVAVL